ncbi:hypothetical protein PHYPO_G00130740 [Pangasianodon hypophthalmus]|uniref:Cystatin domain-containing protein n=1 Tax=Pangasianodon hypophthalmus TaxID=310915 RepID=A0A5N5KJR7_PANHP|nr:leukocyte cysteine proteinase inhibitor 1 [Pangasianodon hypophthalmus]XP_034154680.1 leukocyte cysteine proteinase inhibitor 1 [Pangasianodon hypophthalmus]KAB5530557.1 hypothetical protein PHYPO_G00130740 [Pangasianodon hypophthalmus]
MSWSSWKEVDNEMESISNKVKHDAEQRCNKMFNTYKHLVYRTQAANDGTNYELKLYVGNNECLVLIVWKSTDPSVPLNLRKADVQPLPEASA